MIWRSPSWAWILLAYHQYEITAQPTWPAFTDDLEDIMFLNQGYRARGFADAVTPCSKGAGPGRTAAAEWIRTAFHDMITGSVYTNAGGLDASIVFEINSKENIGSAFNTTVATYAPFLSSRPSVADIIALGVYTATRACGGPVIPIRAGRIDATKATGITTGGVPLPENALGTFKNQFLRVGYNSTEMIQFVACGHSIGGVHSDNFPLVVPANTAPNGFISTDSTPALFDNKVVTEYLDWNTKNPLVVGPSTSNGRDSDSRIFNSDKNTTMQAMRSVTAFADICRNMFQKMIEVVPSGTVLSTDFIQPYEVKPYDLQLTLVGGGTEMTFTGDIRVRTIQRVANTIAKVELVYRDRNGEVGTSSIDTAHSGDARGFDDTFSFFSFSAKLLTNTSISSFNVLITSAGGTEVQDNNGAGFRVDDGIIFQKPQSCLDGSGNLTVVAAVREDGYSSPYLQVVVKNPRPSPLIVPALSTATAAMSSQSAAGTYQLYSASYTLTGSQAQSASFGVFAGGGSDNYKGVAGLPTVCSPLSSEAPTPTPSPLPSAFLGCYLDKASPRALSGPASFDEKMTVEKCFAFCSSFQFFGVEYSTECYCGNVLDPSSVVTAYSDCNMPCAGDPQQVCGAGNRISLYKNNNYRPTVSPNITGYSNLGCYSEGMAGRALSDNSTASDIMTVESCVAFCDGAEYFGVEYGRECYCGAGLREGSVKRSDAECSMFCAGDRGEFCGAGNRLNLYRRNAVTSGA